MALLLVFAAFDDITTDDATGFSAEYVALSACAGWFLFLAWRLFREGHQVLAGVSWLALASSLWGQRGINPGINPELSPEYLVTTTAYVWFYALSLILLWRGIRAYPARNRLRGDL